MSKPQQLPGGVPDFADVEEERPRRLRWLLGLLALGLAVAMLATGVTRLLLPGRVSWGSGVILGGGYVLTCEHVVRDGVSFTVHWEGRAYEAEVVASSPPRDLALLEAEGVDGAGIAWSRWRVLGPGDMVLAVGYPAGTPRPATVVGEILQVGASAVAPGDVWLEDLVLVHGAYEGGMSGAPLVNMWGEVVGVVSGSLTEEGPAGVGLAVSADSARRWLAGAAPEVTLREGDVEDRLEISRVADVTRGAVVRLEVTLGRLDVQERRP